MNPKRIAKRFFSLAVASAIMLSAGTGYAQEKVRIGYVPVSDYLPAFVAQDKGYFKAHGLNVELQRVPLISNIPPALLADDLQIGNNTPTGFLQAVDAGLDLVIVAGAARISKETNPVSLAVRPDAGIHTPADLKGKRLAVSGLRSSLDFLLRKWLEERGVDPKDIKFVEIGFPLQSDALKSKQIDAAVVAEPFRSRMYAAGIAEKLSDFLPEVANNQLGNFWQSTRKWAESHKPQIVALRESMQQAIDFMKDNEAEARQIEKDYLRLETPNLPNVVLNVKPEDLKFYLDLCRQYGVIEHDLDLSKLIVQ
jgi:NitT/TauT family transport system substrate-binding protein